MNMKKIVAVLTAGVLVMGAMTGCGKSDTQESTSTEASVSTQESTEKTTAAQDSEADAEGEEGAVSGKLVLVGSTSMEKMANALKESFMNQYPDVTVNVEFNGSSAGIEAVLAGTADIGNSSRNLKESEVSEGAVENIVAIDGIAVVVNPENTVTELTKEDLISIYKGEVTNWSAFGGDSEPIVVVGREAGSGTRGAFEELLEIEDACAYANELDSTGAVLAKVASTKGAIGYVSLDVVDDTVIAVTLDGTEPTVENIQSGAYFLCRPFVMATKGEISEQNELVQLWFEYLASEEGQAVIEGAGLILP